MSENHDDEAELDEDDEEQVEEFIRAMRRALENSGGPPMSEIPPFVPHDAGRVACHFCGRTWRPTAVDGFDLSREDEYYPRMVPVCPENVGVGCR